MTRKEQRNQIPETSLDLSDDDYLRFEYTPEKEVKNLIQKKAELVPGFLVAILILQFRFVITLSRLSIIK